MDQGLYSHLPQWTRAYLPSPVDQGLPAFPSGPGTSYIPFQVGQALCIVSPVDQGLYIPSPVDQKLDTCLPQWARDKLHTFPSGPCPMHTFPNGPGPLHTFPSGPGPTCLPQWARTYLPSPLDQGLHRTFPTGPGPNYIPSPLGQGLPTFPTGPGPTQNLP